MVRVKPSSPSLMSPTVYPLACLVVSVFIVLASSRIVKAQKEIERN